MGKQADNERHKVRATFYGNVAAGLALAGVLVPYLTYAGRLGTLVARVQSGTWPAFEEQANAVAIVTTMVLAFTGARSMMRKALQEAGKIAD